MSERDAAERVIEAAKVLRRWWKAAGETMDERAREFDRALAEWERARAREGEDGTNE